jgi:hypothetical protein
LLRHHGRPADAIVCLQPIYDRFTEGFGTADLIAAKQLLHGLKRRRSPVGQLLAQTGHIAGYAWQPLASRNRTLIRRYAMSRGRGRSGASSSVDGHARLKRINGGAEQAAKAEPPPYCRYGIG